MMADPLLTGFVIPYGLGFPVTPISVTCVPGGSWVPRVAPGPGIPGRIWASGSDLCTIAPQISHKTEHSPINDA